MMRETGRPPRSGHLGGGGIMGFRTGVSLAFAALLLAGPAPAQEAATSRAQILAGLTEAEIARRVQTVLDSLEGRPEFVGLSVAVARGDQVIVDRGAGLADLEWNQPADAETVFRIGSVTKQFTAAAIMKLVEQGKLALDDPLARYVPDFDTGGRTVTIRQLLNQTSGIPNYTAQPEFIAKGAIVDLSQQELLQYVAGKPFSFEPGQAWQYSNTNYYLLGMIVEKVSGDSYSEFLDNVFFKPLGLTHTRYGFEGPVIPKRAQGYALDPDRRERSNDQPISMLNPGGAGALVSTAGDLVRWQIALTNGRAVSADSFRQMITSTARTGNGNSAYGFGLGVDEVEGQTIISHNGGINGFNSSLTWLPDSALRVAVISNSQDLPSGWVDRRIAMALTSNDPLPGLRTTPQPGAEAALRKLIENQVNGTPDYETMSPQLAEAVRVQLPQLQPLFRSWGAIKAITFVRTDLDGLDTYRVDFANGGAAMFSIFLSPDGKIATTFFRPAASADNTGNRL
jgi:CubicO group peptidase (beta-lactamase class C family)